MFIMNSVHAGQVSGTCGSSVLEKTCNNMYSYMGWGIGFAVMDSSKLSTDELQRIHHDVAAAGDVSRQVGLSKDTVTEVVFDLVLAGDHIATGEGQPRIVCHRNRSNTYVA